MPGVRIDGNDVLISYAVTRQSLEERLVSQFGGSVQLSGNSGFGLENRRSS
jgi:hypothetical protein